MRGWPLIGREHELAGVLDLDDPFCGGVLLQGPPGTGKTELANSVLSRAAAEGMPTARVVGVLHAQSVPMASVAHLLPVDLGDLGAIGADANATGLFLLAQSSLRAQAGDGRLVVMVDDADLVDPFSQSLLASLVPAGVAVLVATLRTGERAEPIEHLVLTGRMRSHVVGPLDRGALDRILGVVLDGPVAPQVVRAFDALSHGNPLVLRESVIHALTTGNLEVVDGRWVLRGPLDVGARLTDVVRARLDRCTDAERRLVTTVAVCGEVPSVIAAELTDDDTVESLVVKQLLVERADRRRRALSAAHPIYGEVLRTVTTPRRLAAVRSELADAVERHGARRREDGLRVAQLRLDSGQLPTPEALLHATRLAIAHRDTELAHRLLAAVPPGARGLDARRLEAELAFVDGDAARVEELCAALSAEALDDTTRAAVTRRRAQNLFFGLSDSRCLAVNRAALEVVRDPQARSALLAHQATLSVIMAQPREALELAAPLLDAEHPRTRLEALMAVSLAEVVAGRASAALEHIERGRREVGEIEAVSGMLGPGSLVFNHVLALSSAGRLEEAVELGRSAIESGEVDDAPSTGPMVELSVLRTQLLLGRLDEVVEGATTCAVRCRERTLPAHERWALALASMALHARGRTGEATAHVRRMRHLEQAVPERGLFHVDIDRANAWHEAATGRLSEARALCVTGADRAARRGLVIGAVVLLFDAVRYGDASVAERLETVAADADQPLIAAMVGGAHALRGGDPSALERAALAFDACQMRVATLEWWLLAAAAHGREGDRRARTRCLAAADGLRAVIGPCWSPLQASVEAAEHEALTTREREVALLAARGAMSKEIAGMLHLSTRTVEHHLQRAYTKLGISSRVELRALLLPDAEVE